MEAASRFFPPQSWIGRPGLVETITTGDLVVMVAAAGTDASARRLIGRACSDRRVHTATFVVRLATADEGLSRTLAQVRPGR